MYVELHQDITYTEFTLILFSRSANTNMTSFGYKNGRYLTSWEVCWGGELEEQGLSWVS